jgi:hypothetical protein
MLHQISSKILMQDVSKFTLKCSSYLADPHRLPLKCSKISHEMQLNSASSIDFEPVFKRNSFCAADSN